VGLGTEAISGNAAVRASLIAHQPSYHPAQTSPREADIQGGSRRELPLAELAAVCVLDAGNNGIVFKADKVLGDGDHARVMVGPQAHWAKLAFERYFLWKTRNGYVKLP
jgi:hypothetical protein